VKIMNNKLIKGIGGVATVVLTLGMLLVGTASADATTAVTAAATDLSTELLAIGTAVLPLAAGVLALTLGWRFAKKFVRG
jgi:hypothetical protein